ncbi:cytidine deaminase-like [Brevipalpus obovatus]|uniref:cytidine deaminase-like n=1 Tax=Brevipalpus obovatus TaxID=246614 RepID=UPI003D9DC807
MSTTVQPPPPLPPQVVQLIEKAKEVIKYAYAPFSKFPVSSAILTADGKTFTGINIENSSYPVGTCAERTAAGKAVSEGSKEFAIIVVYAPTGTELTYPCGACRQFLYEFGHDLIVYVCNDHETRKHHINELLPYGFRLNSDR